MTYWAVFNKRGALHPSTIRTTRKDAIAAFEGAFLCWPAYFNAGYRCRKVKIEVQP